MHLELGRGLSKVLTPQCVVVKPATLTGMIISISDLVFFSLCARNMRLLGRELVDRRRVPDCFVIWAPEGVAKVLLHLI